MTEKTNNNFHTSHCLKTPFCGSHSTDYINGYFCFNRSGYPCGNNGHYLD